MEGRANNASRFSNEFPNEGRNGTFLQEGKCARGIKARRDTLSACRAEEWVGSSRTFTETCQIVFHFESWGIFCQCLFSAKEGSAK